MLVVFPRPTRTSECSRTDLTVDAFGTWTQNRKLKAIIRPSGAGPTDQAHLLLLDVLDFASQKVYKELRYASFRSLYRSNSNFLAECLDDDGWPKVKDLRLGVRDLTEKMSLLLEYLGVNKPSLRCDVSNDRETTADELMSRMKQMNELAIQNHESNQVYLNMMVSRSNLRESKAVRRLANLASAFLPLTLAAGVLSTQHRLVESSIILWDFLTLCLDLGVIVVFLLWMATSRHFRTARQKFAGLLTKNVFRREAFDRRLLWLSLPVCITTFIAANLGTFYDIEIAWRVLAYGAAGGIGFLFMHLIVGIYVTGQWFHDPYFVWDIWR